jgi:uncharacterized membrane protein
MRLELLHPVIIVFPICLFYTGFLLRFVAYLMRKNQTAIIFLNAAWISLTASVLLGMVAIFTGELASEIVGPSLCDPSILNYHKLLAISTVTVISCGLLMDYQRTIHCSFSIIGTVFYTMAAILMIATGSFGGNLVFEQGAAVNNVCKKKEFSRKAD